MSVSAYIICRTCKEEFWLGKWLRTDDGTGFGFWVNQLPYEVLGLKALNFLARHTNHQVQVLSDGEYDKLSWTEPLHEYKKMHDLARSDWPADAERE
jgi:hypothetical protein